MHVQKDGLVLGNVNDRLQEDVVVDLIQACVDVRQEMDELVHWRKDRACSDVMAEHSVQIVKSHFVALL